MELSRFQPLQSELSQGSCLRCLRATYNWPALAPPLWISFFFRKPIFSVHNQPILCFKAAKVGLAAPSNIALAQRALGQYAYYFILGKEAPVFPDEFFAC